MHDDSTLITQSDRVNVRRLSDHKANWAMVGVMIAMGSQLFVIVWGAAMLSSGLSQLRETVSELKVVGQNLTAQMSQQASELAGLKATVQIIKEREK